MFRITTRSQVNKLLTILSVVGEFPFDSRGLLGSEGYFNNLIYKHTRPDDYSFSNSDKIIHLFRNNIGNFPDRKWLVLCFHHQAKFLREYLGPGVRLKVIPMAEVMEKLNIKRREII